MGAVVTSTLAGSLLIANAPGAKVATQLCIDLT
jgi:hypothetical protein